MGSSLGSHRHFCQHTPEFVWPKGETGYELGLGQRDIKMASDPYVFHLSFLRCRKWECTGLTGGDGEHTFPELLVNRQQVLTVLTMGTPKTLGKQKKIVQIFFSLCQSL